MLSKALLVVKSKVALAVLGVVLVGGGGTAVAVAATGGHLPGQSAQSGNSAGKSSAAGSHAHTIGMEGVLKGYDATAKTISVLGDDDTSATTISVNADTKVNGEHASTLADLTNAVGHKVEVQATKQSDGALLAWKITVEGATGDQGQGQGQGQGQRTELLGTIASVGASSFVIKLSDGSTKTVTINASTEFEGRAHKLADLKVGDSVSVHGSAQSDGTFAATSVEDH